MSPLRRETITISTLTPPALLLPSNPAHTPTLQDIFPRAATTRLLESTARLKRALRANPADFWTILTTSLAEITGAQYVLATRRLDDSTIAYGDPGSGAVALALYDAAQGLRRNVKYSPYGSPCAWMRDNRTLLVREGLQALAQEDPLGVQADACLAVPLFGAEGNCLGHFELMWSAGAQPGLEWGELEMLLYALEDVVVARVLEEGMRLEEPQDTVLLPVEMMADSVPHVDKRPSLRPYARRLSHELRTPMQGVVGMLDVMYATVMEAAEAGSGGFGKMKQLREVIDGLRANIEVAQDSSKRAVDAADNMVQAYDFNMEIPATPSKGTFADSTADAYSFPVTSSGSSSVPKKRRLSSPSPSHLALKLPHIDLPPASPSPLPTITPEFTLQTSPRRSRPRSLTPSFQPEDLTPPDHLSLDYFTPRPTTPLLSSPSTTPSLAATPCELRPLLHEAIHYSLRTGGRPEVATTHQTPHGESVTVTTSADTTVTITLFIAPDVPDSIILDPASLTKIISAVFHNAFKFTPSGTITLHAALSPTNHILFTITDTGTGIPADFLPEMFKPFSREDDSLTRNRDGLGLGLMVAKSIARKMHGELWCHRTSTTTPSGTEFRVRLPITPTPHPTSPQPHYDPALAAKLPLRILVAEDNRINRQLLCNMLRKLGYNDVAEAADGVEAVERFREGGFGLVLMDLWMPRMDGFQAAGEIVRLREERAGDGVAGVDGGMDKACTIVAVSADATEEARGRAKGVGIEGFVEKPFTLRELGKAVWRWGGVEA